VRYHAPMRLTSVVFLIVASGALADGRPAQQPPPRQADRFQSGVEVTTITATVRGMQGELVTGIPRDRFEVFEDGVRQEITQFTNERVPVGLGVLLDVSDSMFGRRIVDARDAVDRFLFTLLAPTDEFFVLAFNHNPRVLTGWTSAPEPVRRALDAVKPTGATAVYDAVIAALPMLQQRTRQRAAVVIISDGSDTASSATLREVKSALLRSDAFVYAIAIDSPLRQPINAGVNVSALREITDESGGRTEVVQSTNELAAAAARIAEELNSQYLLGYSSPRGADGQYHSIRVRIPAGNYRVRARSGYVALPVRRRAS
jgi:Ca-activated chloride channel homolog